MRRASAIATVFVLLVGCGGDDSGSPKSASDGAESKTPRTDQYGNVIEKGEDWSGTGNTASSGKGGESGSGGGGEGEAAQGAGETTSTAVVCVTPTTPPEFAGAPPNPFGTAENDFPLEVTVSPKKADPGELLTVEVLAPAQSDALAVIIARFHDGDAHGMKAAKFTDVAGRAEFVGPIPADAPQGLAYLTASVSYPDNRSAIARAEFTVTGPNCP